MTKVSYITRSGNAGELSVLMEGRTDWERYPASMRAMVNCVAAQQGPFMSRSGTYFGVPARYKDRVSVLEPFEFSVEQAQQIEFAHQEIRFVDEQGVLTYTPVSITQVVSESPFVIRAPGLDAAIGEQVALAGFPDKLNMNGKFGTVTAVGADDYTLDIAYANPDALPTPEATAARVYVLNSPYDESVLQTIYTLQHKDVLFVFADENVPRMLRRKGALDWELVEMDFYDGPYFDPFDDGTYLTPSSTGTAASNATGTASGGSSAGNEATNAFDEDEDTFWESDTNQTGILTFNPHVDFACTGYAIQMAVGETSGSFTDIDYAPGDFDFEGFNGSTWVALDTQHDYVLYDGNISEFFEINDKTVYQQYRLNVHACTRNGGIAPRVAQLWMASESSVIITLTANQTGQINGGAGFEAGDARRNIRLKGSDGVWRPFKITSVFDNLRVEGKIQTMPLPDTQPIHTWRMGHWGGREGWPMCAGLFEQRMIFGGAPGEPTRVVGSIQEDFENLTPTSPYGEVLDDLGFSVELDSKSLEHVRWIETDQRGILIGTSGGEWTMFAPDTTRGFGPLNIRARRSTRRGAARTDAIAVDQQILYIQRGRRQVREMSYLFDVDGYRVPSMSTFSSHIGQFRFQELTYAAEPHSIVWVRLGNGWIAGLTYNREENVIGWHRHYVGGEVESISVIEANDEQQDTLWMVVKREVNGETVRYIERLAPFWDFGDTLVDNAMFLDSALERVFTETVSEINGLWHLEGKEAEALVDGVPIASQVVENGTFKLIQPASGRIVVGLPFEAYWVTARPDVGAQDGTSMAKTKRVDELAMYTWDSRGGEFGILDEDKREVIWQPIEYRDDPVDVIEVDELPLKSDIIGPMVTSPGYGKDGSIYGRQRQPLPFNIIFLAPQLTTQDR